MALLSPLVTSDGLRLASPPAATTPRSSFPTAHISLTTWPPSGGGIRRWSTTCVTVAPPNRWPTRRGSPAGVLNDVDDLETVRRRLGRDRIDLVAHSYVGVVAALYCGRAPGSRPPPGAAVAGPAGSGGRIPCRRRTRRDARFRAPRGAAAGAARRRCRGTVPGVLGGAAGPLRRRSGAGPARRRLGPLRAAQRTRLHGLLDGARRAVASARRSRPTPTSPASRPGAGRARHRRSQRAVRGRTGLGPPAAQRAAADGRRRRPRAVDRAAGESSTPSDASSTATGPGRDRGRRLAPRSAIGAAGRTPSVRVGADPERRCIGQREAPMPTPGLLGRDPGGPGGVSEPDRRTPEDVAALGSADRASTRRPPRRRRRRRAVTSRGAWPRGTRAGGRTLGTRSIAIVVEGRAHSERVRPRSSWTEPDAASCGQR